MQPDATPRGAITGLPLENQGGVLGMSIQWFCSPIGLPDGAVSMWWVPIPESQLGPKAWSGKLLPSPPNSQDRFPRRETSSSQRSQAMKRMKKKSTIFIDPPNH